MANTMTFTKISENNGSPRYAVHHLNFLTPDEIRNYSGSNYSLALRRAKALGGTKYHNKRYGGGIAFYTTDIPQLEARILELVKKATIKP